MRRWAAFLAAVIVLTAAGRVFGREPAGAHASRALQAKEAARRHLSGLVAALWPWRAGRLAGNATAVGNWAEADRRLVWTRALYQAAGLLGPVPSIVSLPGGAGTAGNPAGAGGNDDAAFSDALAGRVRQLGQGTAAPSRAAPRDQDQVLGVGGNVDGDQDARAPTVFAPPDGGLSWPVAGRVAARFAPSGDPPRLGVVVAAPEGSPVLAAADGQVVFTGALRGLGRVLILSHGGRRHTVYACLQEVGAAVGDVVRRDAILGRSGFCGPTRAPGVYFELRFREKALNPAEWLAARR